MSSIPTARSMPPLRSAGRFQILAGDERLKEAARRGRAATVSRYLICGEYVTMAEMAARLGISPVAAKRRWQKLRTKPGAITWERLAEAGGA